MKENELKQVVEALLFITDHPIGIAKICEATGHKDKEKVGRLIGEIQRDYEDRGAPMRVLEIAEGFQMATRPEHAKYVRNLYKEKMTMRLSAAALETISIIAYKQPITRAEVEEIRGVEVIAALETLLEKGLVRVVGRKESVGRPLLYGTTIDFLRQFGLRSIKDLPPLEALASAAEEGGETVPVDAAAPTENVDASPAGSEPEEPVEQAQEAPTEAVESTDASGEKPEPEEPVERAEQTPAEAAKD